MHYTRNWLKRNPENAPVFFRLIPEAVRSRLLICFAFARGAEELSQDAYISEGVRRARLLALENALATADEGKLPPVAIAFCRLAPPHTELLSCARDLLSSFVQDILKTRYHDYRDLQDYSQRATLPVAQAVLILLGELHPDKAALTALCLALQILGHLQDAGDDYVNHDRIFLPLDWFEFAQVPLKKLAGSDTDKRLRLVFDRALDNCATLLEKARPLAATLNEKEARHLVAFVHEYAVRLQHQLRKSDPLASRVTVGKLGLYLCLLKAKLHS